MLKKRILISLSIIFLFFFALNSVHAVDLGDAFSSNYKASADKMGFETGSVLTPEAIVAKLIFYALYFLGVIFLILTIYGGFLWMTSRGNEKQTDKAREVLTASIIGLIIIISAYAISWLIIKTFSGYLN